MFSFVPWTQLRKTWRNAWGKYFRLLPSSSAGYGHVAPLSEGGKLFCVFFAMVGIPLTLILFTAIIERLSLPAEKLYLLLRRLFPEAIRWDARVVFWGSRGNLTLGNMIPIFICRRGGWMPMLRSPFCINSYQAEVFEVLWWP